MKRLLLLSAAFMLAVGSQAQMSKTTKISKSEATSLPTRNVQYQIATTAKKGNAPRRLKEDGLYYQRPEGTFYAGWNPTTGRGYYFTTLVVPAFQDLVFKNMSANGVTWTQPVWGDTGITGETELPDEGGYITLGMNYRQCGPRLEDLPTITNRSGSYTLGEYNYLLKNGYTEILGQMRTDSLEGLWSTDPHAAELYEGKYYGPYASWGILNDNLFGSGNYQVVDEKTQQVTASYPALGVSQVYYKPASPLYVESIYVNAISNSQTPLPADATLYAYITGTKMETYEYTDGSTEEVKVADMDNILETLICTIDDIEGFTEKNSSQRNGRDTYDGTLRFWKPGEPNPMTGDVAAEPFIIDEEFAIVLYGFNAEGVDCGIYGMRATAEDAEMAPQAEVLLQVGEEVRSVMYSDHIMVDICLYGMFDKVNAPEQPNLFTFENEALKYNVVRVPVEGSPEEYGYGNLTDGATGSPLLDQDADGYPGAVVFTNTYWYDEENEMENYEVIDLPDWIETYSIDPSLYDKYGGITIVSFFAQPLPDGVTGRSAKVKIVGRSVMADNEEGYRYSAESQEITIIQGTPGDDPVPTAISSVKTNENANILYNLNGQRVNGKQKGIYISNGKKLIIK